MIQSTIKLIQKEYIKSEVPWIIGFSGGKDSSLVVKFIFETLLRIKKRHLPIHIVYCDTGVEIPIVDLVVKESLKGIQEEAIYRKLPIKCHIATPPLIDRFFVKVIGSGYPTPTNKFRWCTDRLRIKPIKNQIESLCIGKCIVLLGNRYDESPERDKTIKRHKTGNEYYFRQTGNSNILIFSPIVYFATEDVWATLVDLEHPNAINTRKLLQLYKEAGSECPMIRDPKGPPCGKGRFGCWTCTVVRKDKAMIGMIKEGHSQLTHLLRFKNWITEIRDDSQYRCTVRRNGAIGLGPFRLSARESIFGSVKNFV